MSKANQTRLSKKISIPVILAVFIIVNNRNSVYFINWCIDKEIGHTHIMK